MGSAVVEEVRMAIVEGRGMLSFDSKVEEREDVGLGAAGLFHLLNSERLDLLNHLTSVDSVLFSEELHSFLFLKDAADFTPLKSSRVENVADSRTTHFEMDNRLNRLRF